MLDPQRHARYGTFWTNLDAGQTAALRYQAVAAAMAYRLLHLDSCPVNLQPGGRLPLPADRIAGGGAVVAERLLLKGLAAVIASDHLFHYRRAGSDGFGTSDSHTIGSAAQAWWP